jgi:hypothetical protein
MNTPFPNKQNTLVAGFHIVHHASGSGYDALANYLPVSYADANNFIFGNTRFGSLKRRINTFYFDFYLKFVAQKYKIVHFLYPEYHLGFTLKPLQKVKKIATMHLKLDWLQKKHREEFDSFKDYAFAKIKFLAFSELNGIITLTHANVQETKYYFPKAKVKFIPHGIHDNSIYFCPLTERNPKFKIITIGMGYRDFDQYRSIVDYALAHEPDWEFHLLSAWQTWQEHFKNYPNVMIHDYLVSKDYFELFNTCDVHLLPLSFATANNAYLEAHSIGIPTVVSNLPSVKDYATSQTLFFSHLEEAIHHLKVLQNLDIHLYNQARYQIKEEGKKFLWTNIATEVMDFYQEIYEDGKSN